MNYFEFWTGDYLKKTLHLDTAEHGAYLMLMVAYYSDERSLPSDRGSLYRICKARTKSHKQAVDKIVDEFFYPSEDGRIHNAKCDHELEKYIDRVNENSRKGKLGGRPPKSNKNEESESYGFSGEKPNESSPIPNPQSPSLNIYTGAKTDVEKCVELLSEIRGKHPDKPKTVTPFEERHLRGLISLLGFEKVFSAIETCGVRGWYGTMQQVEGIAKGTIKEKDFTTPSRNGFSDKQASTTQNSPAYRPYDKSKENPEGISMPEDIRKQLNEILPVGS